MYTCEKYLFEGTCFDVYLTLDNAAVLPIVNSDTLSLKLAPFTYSSNTYIAWILLDIVTVILTMKMPSMLTFIALEIIQTPISFPLEKEVM